MGTLLAAVIVPLIRLLVTRTYPFGFARRQSDALARPRVVRSLPATIAP
jgi:hypothetical protein